jgi:hypothetical protein
MAQLWHLCNLSIGNSVPVSSGVEHEFLAIGRDQKLLIGDAGRGRGGAQIRSRDRRVIEGLHVGRNDDAFRINWSRIAFLRRAGNCRRPCRPWPELDHPEQAALLYSFVQENQKGPTAGANATACAALAMSGIVEPSGAKRWSCVWPRR